MRRAVLIELAEQAGEIALRHRGSRAETKPDGSPVTEGDVAVESALRAEIARRWPEHAILGEEEGRTEGRAGLWIIDPIDGTANYAGGSEYWCVSIAFATPHDTGWQVSAGVVHQPSTGRCWSAVRGEGAQRNDARLVVEDVHPSQALVATALAGVFPGALGLVRPLHRALTRCRALRIHGSAALDLVAIADGRLHGFFQNNLYPWDFAAGALIVEEAGGLVTGRGGRALVPIRRELVLAGVPTVHGLLSGPGDRAGAHPPA